MQQTPQQVKSEERSMMMVLLLVILVLFGFQYMTKNQVLTQNQTSTEESLQANNIDSGESVEASPVKEAILLPIENKMIQGKISSAGGALKELVLTHYKETIAPDSPDVVLLSKNYFVDLKWQGKVALPKSEEEWTVSGDMLTPENPLTFSWRGKDVELTRIVHLDEDYMFTFEDRLKNIGAEARKVSFIGQITRAVDEVPTERTSVHSGFVSLVDNRLQEEAYDKVKEKSPLSYQTKGGWVGMTDKYWQTILVPEQSEALTFVDNQLEDMYISDFKTEEKTVASGESIAFVTHVFAGAKSLDLINAYQEKLNIPKFDLTIDFGWFYFLTKPFLYFLQWLYALVGNMGIAILVFATLLRLLLLPVATKSYISMAKMRKIQPQMQALQVRYQNDRVRLQQEIMALYRREKVNPAGGCLPMLIQIPVLFSLYKVLSVSLQMRQAPFFGWIKDLSAADPSSVFTLFGLVPWPIPSFLNLGIMPILMGLTMYIQQKMTPSPAGADKTQMNMFKLMPVMFTFMMGQFAVGLVIYWTWGNILSIAQQKYITKKVG